MIQIWKRVVVGLAELDPCHQIEDEGSHHAVPEVRADVLEEAVVDGVVMKTMMMMIKIVLLLPVWVQAVVVGIQVEVVDILMALRWTVRMILVHVEDVVEAER